MIRITTDRAIEKKIMEIRDRDYEQRFLNERLEHIEERLRFLERAEDERRWAKETCEPCEVKTNGR